MGMWPRLLSDPVPLVPLSVRLRVPDSCFSTPGAGSSADGLLLPCSSSSSLLMPVTQLWPRARQLDPACPPLSIC